MALRPYVEFCVGVKGPFAAAGSVVPLETPSGVAAMTTHPAALRTDVYYLLQPGAEALS